MDTKKSPVDIIFSTLAAVDEIEDSSFSSLENSVRIATSWRTALMTLSNPDIPTKLCNMKRKSKLIIPY